MDKISISFDAMGGDHAPDEIVKGAVLASRELKIKSHIVGKISEIKRVLIALGVSKASELSASTESFVIQDSSGLDLEIHEANDEIDMGEKNPARAVKKAVNSSIVVSNRLVAEGKADAVVAAGNTGAATAAALFGLKRIPGFERPCIVCFLPTIKGLMLLIDAGSNIESTANHIYQNALIGDILAKSLLGSSSPRVGLLNVGGEPGKGNALYKEAYELIEQNKDLNFVGNVEGKTIIHDNCEVAVCDGFVGNIHLKALEGGVKMFEQILKNKVKTNPIATLAAMTLKAVGVFDHIKNKLHPSSYGGAMLGGVNGIMMIAHGSSDAEAIKNAARQAKKAVEADVINQLKNSLGS